jgi:hypothetical protein
MIFDMRREHPATRWRAVWSVATRLGAKPRRMAMRRSPARVGCYFCDRNRSHLSRLGKPAELIVERH